MSKPKILLVSTDEELREAVLGLAEKYTFTCLDNAEEGLALLTREKGFFLAFAGLALPGMDGLEFLAQVRDRHPKIVRILATGHGNFDIALDALNKGHVFRFLTKPCPSKVLVAALEDAAQLFGQSQAEARLFQDTVHGCVKMLVDILELTSPAAIGRGTRIREWVRQACIKLKVGPLWLLDMAALLSHIGCVGLPKIILHKLETGEDLNKEELAVFRTHPEIAVQLLGNIPRMGKVAQLIRYQNESCRRDPPKGSRILRVCLDLDYLGRKGVAPDKAIEIMRGSPGTHDPAVVEAVAEILEEAEQAASLSVTVAELKPGMVMLADMVTKAGAKLLLKGQPLSAASHMRLQAFADLLDVVDPIRVIPPEEV
jgi:response regulator RpfG family c-di-GMP phosphodiesterase